MRSAVTRDLDHSAKVPVAESHQSHNFLINPFPAGTSCNFQPKKKLRDAGEPYTSQQRIVFISLQVSQVQKSELTSPSKSNTWLLCLGLHRFLWCSESLLYISDSQRTLITMALRKMSDCPWLLLCKDSILCAQCCFLHCMYRSQFHKDDMSLDVLLQGKWASRWMCSQDATNPSPYTTLMYSHYI